MAQFDVYENPNPASQKSIPYLLDVQTDLLDNLATRQPVSQIDRRVEHPRVQVTDCRGDDSDQHEPAQLSRIETVLGFDEPEHRRKAHERAVDRVGGP